MFVTRVALLLAMLVALPLNVQAQLTTGTVNFDTNTLYTQDVVTVSLSDGASLILIREYVVDHEVGGYTWVGSVQSNVTGRAFLAASGAEVVGTIWAGDRLWRVVITGDTVDPVEEIDPTAFPEGKDTIQAPIFEDGFEIGNALEASALQTQCDDAVIDVMVLYTDDADDARGDIKAEIYRAITMANDAFKMSHITPDAPDGIDLRLQLVYMQRVLAKDEAFDDMEKRLEDFTSRGERIPYVEQVHTLRESYSADLSILITEYGNAGGFAWSDVRQEHAFAIVKRSYLDSNVLAHEVGHLFGALHDKYAMGGGNLQGSNYGYVHKDILTGWRTIMAYRDDCTDSFKVWCPRIGKFSSPDYSHDGNPTGTSDTDNRAQIIKTADKLACYRDSKNFFYKNKEWRRWDAVAGTYSFDQLAQVCDVEGSGRCSGSIDGKNFSGWTLASLDEVIEMLEGAAELPAGSLATMDFHPDQDTPYATNVINKLGGFSEDPNQASFSGLTRTTIAYSDGIRAMGATVIDNRNAGYDSQDHFLYRYEFKDTVRVDIGVFLYR